MSLAGQYSSIIAAGRVAPGPTGAVRILQIRGRLFQARHSENAIAKTRRRRRRGTKEACGPSPRKKSLVRVFNLLVYTRVTPPTVQPLAHRRYFATLRWVIGDVSAFLWNSLDKPERVPSAGFYRG